MKFVFLIYKGIAGIIALLPFPLLYLLSGILYLLFRFITRYRRKVILENLRHSFPGKSDKQLKKIAFAYYRNLADITLEVIKLRHIRPAELKRRFTFEGLELLTVALENNRSVIIAIGHCGNWEWMGTALGLVCPNQGYALIKPLTNEHFHAYMQDLRHRLNPGSTLPFRSAFREMVRRRNKPSFYVIAADQTPTRDEAHYWTRFLNQDTPFFMGIEKISRSLDTAVLYVDIQRTGRGKYCGTMHLIASTPRETDEQEITLQYVRLLENSIRQDPSNWLWSHRRWKHSRVALP
jgi:KDO2-lipid IV(A) lauroyltransferase